MAQANSMCYENCVPDTSVKQLAQVIKLLKFGAIRLRDVCSIFSIINSSGSPS